MRWREACYLEIKSELIGKPVLPTLLLPKCTRLLPALSQTWYLILQPPQAALEGSGDFRKASHPHSAASLPLLIPWPLLTCKGFTAGVWGPQRPLLVLQGQREAIVCMVLVLVMVVVVPSWNFGSERHAPILLDAERQAVRAAEPWGRERVAVEGVKVGI